MIWTEDDVNTESSVYAVACAGGGGGVAVTKHAPGMYNQLANRLPSGNVKLR